jgi:hypothetical protein
MGIGSFLLQLPHTVVFWVQERKGTTIASNKSRMFFRFVLIKDLKQFFFNKYVTMLVVTLSRFRISNPRPLERLCLLFL